MIDLVAGAAARQGVLGEHARGAVNRASVVEKVERHRAVEVDHVAGGLRLGGLGGRRGREAEPLPHRRGPRSAPGGARRGGGLERLEHRRQEPFKAHEERPAEADGVHKEEEVFVPLGALRERSRLLRQAPDAFIRTSNLGVGEDRREIAEHPGRLRAALRGHGCREEPTDHMVREDQKAAELAAGVDSCALMRGSGELPGDRAELRENLVAHAHRRGREDPDEVREDRRHLVRQGLLLGVRDPHRERELGHLTAPELLRGLRRVGGGLEKKALSDAGDHDSLHARTPCRRCDGSEQSARRSWRRETRERSRGACGHRANG